MQETVAGLPSSSNWFAVGCRVGLYESEVAVPLYLTDVFSFWRLPINSYRLRFSFQPISACSPAPSLVYVLGVEVSFACSRSPV